MVCNTWPPVASWCEASKMGHYRHAYGNAIAHLFKDARLRAVGDRIGNFDAAVDRSRMHHDRVRPGAGKARFGHAPFREVGIVRGDQRMLHAFLLQAQHDHHIDAALCRRDVVVHAAARQGLCFRQQRGWTGDAPL